jgi:hypothetical protein
MPAEITQTNNRVAEVRFTCDSCGQLIGTRLMPRKQADTQLKSQVICQHCKEEKTDPEKKQKN